MGSYQTGTVFWGVIAVLIIVALGVLVFGIARLIPRKPDESGKLFTPFTIFIMGLMVVSMSCGNFFLLKLLTGDVHYWSLIDVFRDCGLQIDDFQIGGLASFLTLFIAGVVVNRIAKLKK